MVSAVGVEHVLIQHTHQLWVGWQLLSLFRGQCGTVIFDKTFVITQHCLGIRITGDKPNFVLTIQTKMVTDRFLLAHGGVCGVRVGLKGRTVEIITR